MADINRDKTRSPGKPIHLWPNQKARHPETPATRLKRAQTTSLAQRRKRKKISLPYVRFLESI